MISLFTLFFNEFSRKKNFLGIGIWVGQYADSVNIFTDSHFTGLYFFLGKQADDTTVFQNSFMTGIFQFCFFYPLGLLSTVLYVKVS